MNIKRPWLVLLGFTALFFWQVFVFWGGYFSPVDILHNLWLFGHFDQPPHNSLLSDVMVQMLPWWRVGKELLFSGNWPLWNTYAGLGQPLLANWQSGFFFPLNWLNFLFDWRLGLPLLAASKIFLSGLGMFLYIKELRLSREAAILSAAAFAFIHFTIVWLLYPLSGLVFLLPGLFWAVERLFGSSKFRQSDTHVKDRSISSIVILTLLFVLGLVAGHPETFFHISFVLALYVACKVWRSYSEHKQPKMLLSAVGVLLAASVLSLVIASVQLLPAAEYIFQSENLVKRQAEQNTFYLPKLSAVLNFAPDFYGNPSIPVRDSYVGLFQNYNEASTGYVGVTMLVLMVLSLVVAWRKPLVQFFGGIAGLSLAVSYKLEPVYWIVVHIPGFSVGANNRMLLFFGFAVCVMAAYGYDRVVSGEVKNKSLLTSAVVTVSIFASLWVSNVLWGDSHVFRTDTNRTYHWQLLSAAMVVLSLFISTTLLWLHRSKYRVLAVSALLLFVFCETGLYASYYNGVTKAKDFYPEVGPISYLKEQQTHSHVRLAAVDWTFPPNLGAWYGIEQVESYDALGLRDTTELFDHLGRGETNWQIKYSLPSERLASFLGINYYLTPREFTAPESYQRVHSNDLVSIYHHDADSQIHIMDRVALASLDADFFGLIEHERVPEGVREITDYTKDREGGVHFSLSAIRPQDEIYILVSSAFASGWRLSMGSLSLPAQNFHGLQLYALPSDTVVSPAIPMATYYQPDSFSLGKNLSFLGLILYAALCVGVLIRRKARSEK